MSRKNNPFDKPPSYYYGKGNMTSPTAGRNAESSAEYPDNDLPENVVPLKTKPDNRTKKRHHTRRSRAEKIVLTISLLLFSLAIGGSFIRHMNAEQTQIAYVGYGSVDIPRVMSGIIVRYETVYLAPVSGTVVFNAADGSRVRRGAVVSSIENSAEIISLSAQSDELSRRIIDIQNRRGEVSVVSDAVELVNNNIQLDLNSRLLHLNTSERRPLYDFMDSLNQNMELRNDMLLNENAGAVRMLVNEHRNYTARINENRTTIAVTEGGILSHAVDGFEDVLSPQNMHYITREQTGMYVGRDSFVSNREVDAGDAVFKIIESNTWYIVAYIENDLAADWAPGRSVRLYIQRGDEFAGHPFWVHTVTRRNNSESFVSLKSDVQMQDFLDMRTVSFKTYDSVYSGLKIPESAITERTFLRIPERYISTVRHNITVVNRQVGNSIEQETINIKVLRGIERKEGYVYILQDFDNIRRGDTILLNAHDTEGYVINELVTAGGVFRTNTGIATFVSINTEGMVSGEIGYVILDPELNRGGIRQHDRIIRDANYRFVREGDIVNC